MKKILVLQLARLGDIYLTWPALKALRRKHPEAQIDLLVREKFVSATEGLGSVDNTRQLKTSILLEPLLSEEAASEDATSEAVERMDLFLQELKELDYDHIINLSFSPLSSYIVNYIKQKNESIIGYDRNIDGTLRLADDLSAYFYAQVGVRKFSRVHMTDIFASLCDVELEKIDFSPPEEVADTEFIQIVFEKYCFKQNAIVVHIGASEKSKNLDDFKWGRVFHSFRKLSSEPIFIIGANNEREKAKKILENYNFENIVNLVGQTSLKELFVLISAAKLLVGCDSMPLHMATMVNTPVINISFQSVNFWETGPLSENSFVLYANNPESMPSDAIAVAVRDFTEFSFVKGAYALRKNMGMSKFSCRSDMGIENFNWQFIQALYMEADFPSISASKEMRAALIQLFELIEMAEVQFRVISEGKPSSTNYKILHEIDNLLEIVYTQSDGLRPLLDWFQTERIRIEPGDLNHIFQKTIEIFLNLKAVIGNYLIKESNSNVENNLGA